MNKIACMVHIPSFIQIHTQARMFHLHKHIHEERKAMHIFITIVLQRTKLQMHTNESQWKWNTNCWNKLHGNTTYIHIICFTDTGHIHIVHIYIQRKKHSTTYQTCQHHATATANYRRSLSHSRNRWYKYYDSHDFRIDNLDAAPIMEANTENDMPRIQSPAVTTASPSVDDSILTLFRALQPMQSAHEFGVNMSVPRRGGMINLDSRSRFSISILERKKNQCSRFLPRVGT